jgi:chaperone required for assembly of F1-ATPase
LNDLLCYRADAPVDLVSRQSATWDHWLQWARRTYGVQLSSTAGLVPINQPPGTGEVFQEILSSHSDYTVAALGVIVPALGSLVLGLALTAQALEPQAACEAAFLDELWQEEQWGTDQEALTRRAKIVEDVAVSARFMYLCPA